MFDQSPPPDKTKTYSIVATEAAHIEEECSKQVLALEELIEYYLEQIPNRRHALALLCEGHSLNYRLAHLLKKLLKNSERFLPEDTEEEEIVVTATDMMVLQTTTLARYYLSVEMAKMENISTSFH